MLYNAIIMDLHLLTNEIGCIKTNWWTNKFEITQMRMNHRNDPDLQLTPHINQSRVTKTFPFIIIELSPLIIPCPNKWLNRRRDLKRKCTVKEARD